MDDGWWIVVLGGVPHTPFREIGGLPRYRPVFCGLKDRCITLNACSPKWCSRQDSHPHWRRSRRRVSAVGLRERTKWVLQPVLIRRDCFTKAICRLLRGGVQWPAEPRLNKQRLPCLTVAARRRLVAASGA